MRNTDSAEIQTLIEKVRNGEHEAYAGIVREYQERIRRLSATLLSDERDADDAAQEIFVKAFYALRNFKGKSSFYTWLYRIATNHCLDRARKKNRFREMSWEELREKSGDDIEKLLSASVAPASSEQKDLVHKILSLLPADYRVILTLREMDELSYEEIAVILHCSLDAVKGRLKRARHDFKEKLQHFMKSGAV